MSGQRACRLVGAKSRAGGQTVTFSESDIETIRSGLFGMSRVPADIMAQIVADEEKYSRQEQDQLNLAIRSAQASLEHLRFEECLRHLQWAISAGRVDERIWEIASQLPYPLNQAGETAVLKETMELLEGRGLGPADEEAMAARFYPVMVGVMGGDFKMGSHEGYSDEEPVRSVHLHGFDMSVTLVTWWQFGLFCLLTGREVPNDAGFGRGDRPAINVSWHDAVDYCIWLSERIGQVDGRGLQQVYTRVGKTVTAEWSNNGYRLPTEAEWEYAAREMGRPVRFGNGMDVADPTLMNFNSELELNELKPDWYRRAKSQQATTPVRTYRPNALGLYDMSGNVYEWCWDWWSAGEHGFYLTSDGVSDPVGSASGERRTIRGGSWLHVANLCRCTGRWRYQPEYRFNCIGFRVVRRHAVLSSG
jgi:formylglycine-generating enzyme required for sulfatase activity